MSGSEKEKPVETLGEALPREMKRVREVLLPQYISIGVPGLIGVAMMNAALDRATKALAEGDLVAMIRAYEDLKGFTE